MSNGSSLIGLFGQNDPKNNLMTEAIAYDVPIVFDVVRAAKKMEEHLVGDNNTCLLVLDSPEGRDAVPLMAIFKHPLLVEDGVRLFMAVVNEELQTCGLDPTDVDYLVRDKNDFLYQQYQRAFQLKRDQGPNW